VFAVQQGTCATCPSYPLIPRRIGSGVKRLNGWDAMLVYGETPNLQMHTPKIAVMDASGV
jgi:hypothetical protein